VLCVAWVYAPGVHGDWGRDDYFQLAFVRMLDSPWPLFVHDHFPVPGSVFRPLGFASMWLGERLFGSDYATHAWSDLALHAGVSIALFALLRRETVSRVPAMLATLCFASHPLAIGTALWWSARFDLLATLFVLLALNAACAYRQRPDIARLVAAMIAALAAMLSKEIGLIGVAAIVLLWLRWAWIAPQQRSVALRASGLMLGCALVYLVWRALVLGTASSGLIGALPLGEAIAKGVGDWLRQAPGYLSFWSRAGSASHVLLCVVLGSIAIALVARGRALRWRIDLLLCGTCLLLLPALLQAPVAALNAQPLSADFSAIEAAMQSRLYYLGLAGSVMLLAVLLERIAEVRSVLPRVAVFSVLALAIAACAFVVHMEARQFAERSTRIAEVAHAAVAAVDALDLPPTACHVVFLGVQPAPEWSEYVSMDSVIKALDPDLARVAHCWFHAEYVTYFHLMPASVEAADAEPWHPLTSSGAAVPWLRVGNVGIAYMQAPEHFETSDVARMRFLRYRDGRFEPADADVAAGRLTPQPK
jgi:hypothetical protein